MDDRSFDTFVRSLASGANRRQLLKGLLGLGGVAVAASGVSDAEAARRPTPTPKPPSCPGQQTWNGSQCVCPAGSDACGWDCCPTGVAQCCDNACCYGICYGEELCCPADRTFCAASGECCPDGWSCCPDFGCLAPGQCCTESDCSDDACASVTCTTDRQCSYTEDCTKGGVETCCFPGQVCLDDGSCCTPECTGERCDDGCGGTCACPEGYGCGDDGECRVCTVCNPVFERCLEGESCYTFCTPDGIVCLSGFPVGNCSSQTDCAGGAYCMETCLGLQCLPPCGPSPARFAGTESQGIDAIAG